MQNCRRFFVYDLAQGGLFQLGGTWFGVWACLFLPAWSAFVDSRQTQQCCEQVVLLTVEDHCAGFSWQLPPLY
jgi:hypothetical protein